MLENKGKRWDEKEENILLSELENVNISYKLEMQKIAENHKRTLTGIKCRINLIAYNLYKKGLSKEQILEKTKLTEIELEEVIVKNDISEMNSLAYNLYKDGVSVQQITERTKLTCQQIMNIVEGKQKKKILNIEEQKIDIEDVKNITMLAVNKALKRNEEEIQLIRETNMVTNSRFEENILEIKKEIKNMSIMIEKILEKIS